MIQPTSGYAGVVTRAIALGVDAATINVIAVAAGAAVGALLSLFGHKGSFDLGTALASGLAWLLWSGAYFVAFWTFAGQTPGDRLLGIRVVSLGGHMSIGRASLRFIGLVLCAAPFFAGFLPVLFDDRRRGPHDRMGGTVVRFGDLITGPEVITVSERQQISAPGGSVSPGP